MCTDSERRGTAAAPRDGSVDRREWLRGLAAAGCFGVDALGPSAQTQPDRIRPRVRRAVHISVCGGFSQLDTFDPKPELDRWHGRPMPESAQLDPFFAKVGRLRRSDWKFVQHGDSGLWVSSLLPHLASVVDHLTVVRSMVAQIANHVPAKLQENTGFQRVGFPSIGAWLSFGLGPIASDLPPYVVIPDARGLPAGGAVNWGSGFLPAEHSGVLLRNEGPLVDYLVPRGGLDPRAERGTKTMLAALHRSYVDRYPSHAGAESRARSYELAARMQSALPVVADLAGESAEIRRLYGVDETACAIWGAAVC